VKAAILRILYAPQTLSISSLYATQMENFPTRQVPLDGDFS